MNWKIEKLTTSDLIMLGVFNATLVLLFYGVVMGLHFFPILWGAMDPIVNFILAPVFLLMLSRVPKVGALTIHGTILGSCHAIMGWWPGFFAGVAAGMLADAVSFFSGGYNRNWVKAVAVMAFVTLKAVIFYSPVYLFRYVPWFDEVLSTWPESQIDKYSAYYAVGFLGANLAACLAGLLLGRRMINRRFRNTGVCPS